MTDIEQEEWRAVVGFEGKYEVSSLGNIRSLDRKIYALTLGVKVAKKLKGKNIKCHVDKHGYHNFVMEKATYKVHTVVAAAFIGPRPEGMIICHWDDDGGNNKVSNLRYATYGENLRDAVRNKKIPALGFNGKGRNKLTKEQYDYIRSFPYKNGLYEKLSRELDVHGTVISRIYRGLSYEKMS